MNVYRLYVASIYISASWEPAPKGYKYGLSDHIGNYTAKFCKETVVYHSKDNCYIDLITKEKYILGHNNVCNVGQMFIYLNADFKPVYKVFDVDFKKDNMSKRRIIRTLSKSKLLDKKEEDK